MIDAIRQIAQLSSKFKPLADFYLEYYEKEIKKSVELDSNELTSLRNQLVQLVRQRADLDSEIARLVEQINALEGGSITNGRK